MFRSYCLTLTLLLSGLSQSLQTCIDFMEVPEDDYDRTYYDITSEDARPLGFKRDTLVYQSSNETCYTISGEDQQTFEIKFETVPSMKLCVRDKNSDYQSCAEGRFTDCLTLSSTTARLQFFCDVAQGCAEGDVNFWLRLTKGPLPADDTEQMWCHNLQEEYPESLRPVPPQFTPAPKPGEETNESVRCLAVRLVTVVCAVITMVVGH